jgi:hypothetical protein
LNYTPTTLGGTKLGRNYICVYAKERVEYHCSRSGFERLSFRIFSRTQDNLTDIRNFLQSLPKKTNVTSNEPGLLPPFPPPITVYVMWRTYRNRRLMSLNECYCTDPLEARWPVHMHYIPRYCEIWSRCWATTTAQAAVQRPFLGNKSCLRQYKKNKLCFPRRPNRKFFFKFPSYL